MNGNTSILDQSMTAKEKNIERWWRAVQSCEPFLFSLNHLTLKGAPHFVPLTESIHRNIPMSTCHAKVALVTSLDVFCGSNR